MQRLLIYDFLVLALLFTIPGFVVWVFRPDLRNPIRVMAACSVPFAFTEWMFYPTYWEPRFLFDLVAVIGFGVEDVLFVVGLAAFTSTGYAFAFRRAYAPYEPTRPLRRVLAILTVTFGLVAFALVVRVPMIYAAPAIMLLSAGVIAGIRPDLGAPSLLGGLVSLGVYTGLCLVFATILPGIFDLAWKADRFLDVDVLGVPVEELLYGFSAGAAATSFYPFVRGLRFVPSGTEAPRAGTGLDRRSALRTAAPRFMPRGCGG